MNKKDIGQVLRDLRIKTVSGNNEGVAVDGGNAVGSVISDMIFNQNEGYQGIFIDEVKKVKAVKGPIVKVRSRVNQLASEPAAGVRAYWVDEGVQSDASKSSFRGRSLELGKLVVRIPATNELVEDIEQLGQSFIEDASTAIGYKIESEILFGLGAIKGIATIGDGATMSVVVSSGDAPTEDELQAFVAALHPMAVNAKWLVNKAVYTVITGIAYTTPNALQFEDGQYYLFGYPVVQAPQMTDSPYGIVLGDFSAFAIAYLEPKNDKSSDVRFLEDETEYRLSMRVAGDSIASKTTLDNGDEVGWFVVNSAGEANQSSSSSSSSSESSASSDSSDSSDSSTSVSSASSDSSSSGSSNSSSSTTSRSSVSSDSSASSDSPG